MIVRRPTLREAKRIYGQLTLVSYEADEKEILQSNQQDGVPIRKAKRNGAPTASKVDIAGLDENDKAEGCSSNQNDEPLILSDDESENELPVISTPLHQAAQSGDSEKVTELLEQGLDPCVKDERGRTPYMLAPDKEVRNTFRRFMASNLDKWDWNAAKVPSALTKEMEESQAAKQVILIFLGISFFFYDLYKIKSLICFAIDSFLFICDDLPINVIGSKRDTRK